MHNAVHTPNQGEGNRRADAEYRQGARNYVELGTVEQDAKRAKDALKAPEGEALRAAEQRAKSGPTGDSAIDRIFAEVKQKRDEARVQLDLAKKDGRDAWDSLESKWADVQTRIDMVKHASSKTAEEAKTSLADLLSHLDDGYRRVKNQLQ
ncbi:MAG: hypothetical protein RIT81_12035 [Deltaproteobacteria bacterium]